jgi:UDP-N-acetylglucosamine:LPS N-acetylglucosamine transferase
VRVLILTADVGHGHVAAGLAVADDLRLRGCEPDVQDGLVALGAVARHIIRDGYRLQLRIAPWSYAVMYALITYVPGVRWAGAHALSLLGRRRLRRLIRRRAPDVVVSTHPALTAVLGRMRLRRQLAVPLCVTVTDMADYALWCHPGADVHLVMHPDTVTAVERIAGPGSAALVAPPVSPAFRLGDQRTARAALGLSEGSRVVAVSGGGWGVGDLEGAVVAALAAGATDVVVVGGDNARVQEALGRRFAGEPRVLVWGFTRQMPELMRAADVLIHSTGGMTSLEAAATGCPLVAYGASTGHIRVHNAAMARLGLLRVAATDVDLRAILAEHLAAPARVPSLGEDGLSPGRVVGTAAPRVRPIAAWRLAAGRATTMMACGTIAIMGMASDDVYSLAARPLDLRPADHVATSGRDVALVVRSTPAAAPGLARSLAQAGANASFAQSAGVSMSVRAGLRAAGDDVLPELGGTTPAHWLRTRRLLAGSPRVGGHRAYLASPAGLSLGQDLVARSMEAEPLTARSGLRISSDQRPSGVAPGDILVVTVSPSDPDGGADLAGVAAALRARGLAPVSVSALASAAAGSAGDRSNVTAAPTTSARAAKVPAAEAAS